MQAIIYYTAGADFRCSVPFRSSFRARSTQLFDVSLSSFAFIDGFWIFLPCEYSVWAYPYEFWFHFLFLDQET